VPRPDAHFWEDIVVAERLVLLVERVVGEILRVGAAGHVDLPPNQPHDVHLGRLVQTVRNAVDVRKLVPLRIHMMEIRVALHHEQLTGQAVLRHPDVQAGALRVQVVGVPIVEKICPCVQARLFDPGVQVLFRGKCRMELLHIVPGDPDGAQPYHVIPEQHLRLSKGQRERKVVGSLQCRQCALAARLGRPSRRDD